MSEIKRKKNILILIGRGKSTITDFIEGINPETYVLTIYGIRDLLRCLKGLIKRNDDGLRTIIHLEIYEHVNKIPLIIKKRALIFKLDF